MAVISTVRAAYSPAPPPSSAPAIITIQPVTVTVPAWMTRARVTAMARTMPPVDTWLPRRAEAGEFIRCRPSTKQVAAPTYSSWVIQSKALMNGYLAGRARRAGAWPLPLTAAAAVCRAGTGVRDRRNILSIRPVTA